MIYDFLIIGQGLVGSLLAATAIDKGYSVMVVDNNHEGSSTRVAAGIMNPITGIRLVKTWDDELEQDEVLQTYRDLEARWSVSLLNERQMIRFLRKDSEREAFEKKRRNPDYEAYLSQVIQESDYSDDFEQSGSGFKLESVYQLDTQVFLSAAKDYLIEQSAYRNERVLYENLSIGDSGVEYKDVSAKKLLFCEGYKGANNPYFSDLDFKNAKGDILELNTEGLDPNTIYNNGQWLCPISDGKYRFGTNVNWEFEGHEVDAETMAALKQDLAAFLKRSHSVLKELTGVRPVLASRKAVYGFHSSYPTLGIINGLGGQGTALAPRIIRRFFERFEQEECFALKTYSLKG